MSAKELMALSCKWNRTYQSAIIIPPKTITYFQLFLLDDKFVLDMRTKVHI